MKRARRRFMRRALMASCIAAAMFLLLAIILGFFMWRAAKADSIQATMTSVNQTAYTLRTIFDSSVMVLNKAANFIEDDGNAPRVRHHTSESINSHLKGVGIIDLNGKGSCSSGAEYDFASDELARIGAGETIVSAMQDNGSDYVVIAVPVGSDEAITGAAYAKLDSASLFQLLNVYSGAGHDVSHYLVDSDMHSLLEHEDSTPLDMYNAIDKKPIIMDNKVQHFSKGDVYQVGNNNVAIAALGIDNIAVMTVYNRNATANRSDVVMAATLMVCICAALFLSLMLIAAIYFRYSDKKLKQSAMELETVTSSIVGGVVRFNCDDQYSIRYLNEGLLMTLGFSVEDMTRKLKNSCLNLIHHDDCLEFKQFVAKLGTPDIQLQMNCRVVCSEGGFRWFLIRGRRITTSGNVDSCICVLTDITAMKEKEQELNLTMQRYAVVIGQSDSIIFEYSFDDGKLYVSEKWYEKFSADLNCENAVEVAIENGLIHLDDVDKFKRMFKRLSEGTGYADCDVRMKSGDDYIWCVIKASAIFDENGHPYKTVGKISDVNRQYNERDMLKKRAEFDPLTGIYNKGACQMLIDSFIKNESGNLYHALVILDIDNFKCVNDTLGHLVGDSVIMDACSRVKLSLRGGDIFGRIGGDEFVVLLKDIGNIDNVKHKIGELCTLLRHSVIFEDTQINISGSIGAIMFSGSSQTYKQLLGKADVVLYEAKRHGKDRYAIYHDGE